MRTENTQIRLRIRTIQSRPAVSVYWGYLIEQADKKKKKKTDQAAQMRRMIRTFVVNP